MLIRGGIGTFAQVADPDSSIVCARTRTVPTGQTCTDSDLRQQESGHSRFRGLPSAYVTHEDERVEDIASGSLATPVGSITVASSGEAIVRVAWRKTSPSTRNTPDDPLLTEGLAQLRAYFDGTLTDFDLPVDLHDMSDAARTVLNTLAGTVKRGDTIAYGELAVRSGTGVSARNIGTIMGSNPVPLLIPCHRVVAADGLGGYSGGESGQGLQTKRWLLDFEGATPPTLF
jgi:methylated-DNA-[protein]-cysteine S-methyltransferase